MLKTLWMPLCLVIIAYYAGAILLLGNTLGSPPVCSRRRPSKESDRRHRDAATFLVGCPSVASEPDLKRPATATSLSARLPPSRSASEPKLTGTAQLASVDRELLNPEIADFAHVRACSRCGSRSR